MLAGFICPCCNEKKDFGHVLQASRERKFAVPPYPVLLWMVKSIRERQSTGADMQVSVTDVVGCPRQAYLRKEEDYYERPEDLLFSLRGALLHKVLADYAQDEAIVETRTSREFGGYTLWGTPDSVVVSRNNGLYVITDWKSTRRVPVARPYSNHVTQVNLYRYLWELPSSNTIAEIVYFGLDDGDIRQFDVPVWPDSVVEDFLRSRFVPLAEALERHTVPRYVDVPSDILKWACSFCPVFNRCFELLLSEGISAVTRFAEASRERGK